jgi:hypothetical protein
VHTSQVYKLHVCNHMHTSHTHIQITMHTLHVHMHVTQCGWARKAADAHQGAMACGHLKESPWSCLPSWSGLTSLGIGQHLPYSVGFVTPSATEWCEAEVSHEHHARAL